MRKTLWLGIALTAAACLVACDDDTGTNSQQQAPSERDVTDNTTKEENPGNVEESSESREDSSSSVEESSNTGDESTELGGSSSSSVKSAESRSSSSSVKSESSSSDIDAEKVWSWDTPKENFLNPEITYRTFVDSKRDNKVYKVIDYSTPKFQGSWFAENLNYEIEGSWCYDDDPEKCDVAGRLYTWDAAMKACPEGWRLPNDEDWAELFESGLSVAGTRLKSMTGWSEKVGPGRYADYNGEDHLGFSAIPAGLWNGDAFCNAGFVAFFWSSTEVDDGNATAITFSGDPVANEKSFTGYNGKVPWLLCSLRPRQARRRIVKIA